MEVMERPKERMVLGVPVTCFKSKGHAAEYVAQTIKKGERTYCVAINPEKVRFAHGDISFHNIVRNATFHICDGAGIAAAVRILLGQKIPRVTGIDLFFQMVKVAEKEDLRVFLLGARPETIKQAHNKLRERHPQLCCVGYRDGYFRDDESELIVQQINELKVDMLFVALGSPKQERWIAKYRSQLEVFFCMGVGGSFDVISGRVKRAPEIFCRTGTEWLYRLVKEPSRWKRQKALLEFALSVLRQRFWPRQWVPKFSDTTCNETNDTGTQQFPGRAKHPLDSDLVKSGSIQS
jgi:N-acetylglucosaminyldiphosphoundecaprenol N-acetyl-beta-D-mannosaminyltransferase